MDSLSPKPGPPTQTERSLRSRLPLKMPQVRPIVLTTAVLLVITFVLGVASGFLAAALHWRTALMSLAGLTVLFVAFAKPELVILLILMISSSVVSSESIPSIYVGFNFTAVEMCLMMLLGLVGVRSLSGEEEYKFLPTPLDWPILLFFAASAISFYNSLHNLGEPRGWLIPQFRVLFDYLIFFAVTNLVRTRQQLKTLVGGMLAIATIVALFTAVQAAVGPSTPIIPGTRVIIAEAFDQEFEEVARVIPPGAFLFDAMFVPALVLLVTPNALRRRKWLLYVLSLVILLAIAMTFSRAVWVGLGLALAVLVFVSPASQRRRIVGVVYAVVMIFFVFALFLNTYLPPRVEGVLEALSARVETLFVGARIVQDQQQRICENEGAIATFKAHPFLGVGPGGELHQCSWKAINRYMHNSYLFILAAVGVVGFLPFTWFSVVFLARGFYFSKRLQDPVLRGLVLAFTLSYIMALVASFAGGELMRVKSVVVIGVMLGLNEVAIRLEQPRKESLQ